jgi:hypothetical protein
MLNLLDDIKYNLNNFYWDTKYFLDFAYKWFFVPMTEGDWYWYWGLYDDWKKNVDPEWDYLDIEDRVEEFNSFWFHKIDDFIRNIKLLLGVF